MSRWRQASSTNGVRLPDWVRGLLVLLVFNGLAVNLVFRAGGWPETSLRYAKRSVLYPTDTSRIVGTDSWVPMTKALDQLHRDRTTPLYSKVFFEEHVKFQYPPTSLLAIDLIRTLPGMSLSRLLAVLNGFSWACMVLVGLLCAILLRDSMRAEFGQRLGDGLKRDVIAFYGVTVLLVFSFYPLTRSFYVGQIQTFITFLATASLLAWHDGKKKTAGVLIGLICTMKPHWGIVLLWCWLRRQWGMALAGTLVVAGLLGVSIGVYGLGHHLDYLSVLSSLSRHGEAYYANQSMNGLMNRLLFNGDNLHFKGSVFPPFHPVVYGCTVALSLLLIGSALFAKRRDGSGPGDLELAIVMLSTTMASPIAWEHHYAILLPILAILLPAALSRRALGRWTIPYLVVAFFLASQRFQIVYGLGRTRLNILQSHVFFAGIMVLVLLHIVLRRKVAVDTVEP